MAPRPRKTGSKDLPPNLYRKTDSRNGVTYYSYRDPSSGKWYGLDICRAPAGALQISLRQCGHC